jgi:hypothetical protein
MRLSFSLGVHTTVFQIDIFAILASARNCMKRKYTKQQIYICSVRELGSFESL